MHLDTTQLVVAQKGSSCHPVACVNNYQIQSEVVSDFYDALGTDLLEGLRGTNAILRSLIFWATIPGTKMTARLGAAAIEAGCESILFRKMNRNQSDNFYDVSLMNIPGFRCHPPQADLLQYPGSQLLSCCHHSKVMAPWYHDGHVQCYPAESVTQG